MATIRAIIIDPFAKTITEQQVPAGDGSAYEAIVAAIFPKDRFPQGDDAGFASVNVDGVNTLYVDDIGLMRDWEKQAFFGWGGHTLAGTGIVVGTDVAGESVDCSLPLGLVLRDVRWLDAREVRVPAPTLTTVGDDGVPRTEYLDQGRAEWTFDSNPGRDTK